MPSWLPFLASAGISAGGSLIGGFMGAGAAEDAQDAQKDYLKRIRKDMAPYMAKGTMALDKLWDFMEDPSRVTEMPGYQFALGEGTNALLKSRAATGNLLSGATGRELTRYGQNFATTNWLNYLRPYQQMAAAGQNAAAGMGGITAGAANNISRNILAEGGAKVGAVGNITNSLTSGVKDYYYMNALKRLEDLKTTPQPYNSNWHDTQSNYLAFVR